MYIARWKWKTGCGLKELIIIGPMFQSNASGNAAAPVDEGGNLFQTSFQNANLEPHEKNDNFLNAPHTTTFLL